MDFKIFKNDLNKSSDGISITRLIQREDEPHKVSLKTSLFGKPQIKKRVQMVPEREPKIAWTVLTAITILHLIGFYGIIFEVYNIKLNTHVYRAVVSVIGIICYTAGVHRYWAHRSYKAKLPLRFILLLGYTLSAQMPVYTWVKLHRMHHKHTDTDLDPHNSMRGFFYSHLGWLMLKKGPEYKSKSREIDMSDVLDDRLVSFHTRYFSILTACLIIIEIMIPVYFWDELFYLSILNIVLQILSGIHIASSVNSIAHTYGDRTYDKTIPSTENMFVSVIACGEGWHNYHHVFPWDYKAGEFGYRCNLTTQFIDFFAKVGWAYDLKSASPDLVKNVWQKRGDGTHISLKNHHNK